MAQVEWDGTKRSLGRRIGRFRTAPRRALKAAVTPLLGRSGYALTYDGDYEDDALDAMALAQPYTMTTRPRMYAMWQAARYVCAADIPGSVVECGVWKGGSSFVAAKALISAGSTARQLMLLDTFSGMTAPTSADVDYFGRSACEYIEASAADQDAPIFARAELAGVQALMGRSGYPVDRIEYVAGDVMTTLPKRAPDTISLLRLDTDWYESTLHELECLFPRMSPGSVLIIDDYGFWQGARRAVDEYLAKCGRPLLLMRVDSGCRMAVVT